MTSFTHVALTGVGLLITLCVYFLNIYSKLELITLEVKHGKFYQKLCTK